MPYARVACSADFWRERACDDESRRRGAEAAVLPSGAVMPTRCRCAGRKLRIIIIYQLNQRDQGAQTVRELFHAAAVCAY